MKKGLKERARVKIKGKGNVSLLFICMSLTDIRANSQLDGYRPAGAERARERLPVVPVVRVHRLQVFEHAFRVTHVCNLQIKKFLYLKLFMSYIVRL